MSAGEPSGGETRPSFLDGVRAGVPFAIAGLVVAVSFGVVAQAAGFSAAETILMSAIVFAGSAQFTAAAILGAGGSPGAAILAAALMNSRFLPMGVALAPSLPGGPVRRALEGQTVVDASWAIASRGDGTFDRQLLFGSTGIAYLTWVGGTAAGAIWGDALGDPATLGLDAVFPAFFLALVIAEARDRLKVGVALLGAAIALALVPLVPPGVPVLLASLAALVGLRRGASEEVHP
jgi:4-azaleucine resistance transporter AzlC